MGAKVLGWIRIRSDLKWRGTSTAWLGARDAKRFRTPERDLRIRRFGVRIPTGAQIRERPLTSNNVGRGSFRIGGRAPRRGGLLMPC
jgi:hypothetical protein